MSDEELTDAEFLVLGLLSEMPRHGYQLEQVIEERGMREWTRIGFSSIYFVLGKLEKRNFVASEKPAGAKARKIYSITDTGREVLVNQTLAALRDLRPTYPSVLLGMAHWPVLQRDEALDALRTRANAVKAEQARLGGILAGRQSMPDFVETLFEYSIGQLEAEAEWVTRTLEYMETKARNED